MLQRLQFPVTPELHPRHLIVVTRRELQCWEFQLWLQGECRSQPSTCTVLSEEEVVSPHIVHYRRLIVVNILSAEDVNLPVIVDHIHYPPHQDP